MKLYLTNEFFLHFKKIQSLYERNLTLIKSHLFHADEQTYGRDARDAARNNDPDGNRLNCRTSDINTKYETITANFKCIISNNYLRKLGMLTSEHFSILLNDTETGRILTKLQGSVHTKTSGNF